jgi:glycosyltransferase involved in cell wall biosynthesis|tara:strand:- start:1605 stop:3728 length:2124 start_codon:yes stop_codon:yes gene_type:complete
MILKKNQKLKIATILPYKENYTLDKASAASLWVSEFYKNSKFKKYNFIYGHTKFKKYLTTNYININLKNLKSKLKSTTNEYSKKLIKDLNLKDYDIVEIHNRPQLLHKLLEKVKNRFIFYFHNDPLSMKGSQSINERIKILNSTDRIIFVSEWVRYRFFLDLDKKLQSKTEVIYPSVNLQRPAKKKKSIIFVGRLNYSKGYDLFKDAISKILDEFPVWKAFSIGDEERRSIYISHPKHKEIGFINHKKTLNILNRSEIAVVPSRWDEPFGRTALEASSRGCATIISNRGGLTETTDHAIIIKKLEVTNLYKEIRKLIKYPKRRKKIQMLGRKNVKHLVKKNTKLIDQVRENCFPRFNLNYSKNRLKIINLYNQGQKLNHRLFNISLGKKFTNGFVRNGHDVLEISDRDYIKNNKSFNLIPDKNNFQNFFIESFKNYNPDLLFFGHTKNLNLETIDKLKSINKNLIIAQWNEDPVMQGLDYSKKNLANINYYAELVDHNFITTHPSVIKNRVNNKNVHFFFVPVDRNIERYDIYKLQPKNDLFYAMSHGVNRATLKEGTEDNRINFLNKLVKKIPNIKYDFYGFSNKQPIWGNDFNNALINSKMALNLSRGKPTKHYSSNRIASIMGNGLLTFVDEKVQMNNFFNKQEIISYSDIADLSDKIQYYTKNEKLRIRVAKNGKRKYFKLFNEKKIAKYIIDVSLGNSSKLI